MESQTKACTRCRQVLDLSAFNDKHRAKGTRQSHCRTCSRISVRDHYARNTAYYIEKAKKQKHHDRRLAGERVLEYLATHPCVDCGEADPVVLEFDHRARSDKLRDVARMLREGSSWRTIQREIDKCDVRCANCHRRRTARQFGWSKLCARSSTG